MRFQAGPAGTHHFAVKTQHCSPFDWSGKGHGIDLHEHDVLCGHPCSSSQESGFHEPFRGAPRKQGAMMIQILPFYKMIRRNFPDLHGGLSPPVVSQNTRFP